MAVHPYTREEYGWFPAYTLLGDGSSPHAWGTLRDPQWHAGGGRFIPTCVGNTGAELSAGRLEAVHPHMRGEHSI